MKALVISVDLGEPDFAAHAEEFVMLATGTGAEIQQAVEDYRAGKFGPVTR